MRFTLFALALFVVLAFVALSSSGVEGAVSHSTSAQSLLNRLSAPPKKAASSKKATSVRRPKASGKTGKTPSNSDAPKWTPPAHTAAALLSPATDAGLSAGALATRINKLIDVPSQFFTPAALANPKVQAVLKAFKADPSYGASVRGVNPKGKTVQQIEAELKPFKCKKELQKVKGPGNAVIVAADGNTIPMVTFICPDGGAIRMKGLGESTSKFRPQPNAVKALRWPKNGPFVTFDDEVVKVTAAGKIVPKYPKDINANSISLNPNVQKAGLDLWANLAHTNIKKSGPPAQKATADEVAAWKAAQAAAAAASTAPPAAKKF